MICPTKKQSQFLQAAARRRFVLYGGAAGGGKSYILRWWLLKYLLELARAGIRNAQVGLFCEDYPSLQDRQISKIRYEFPRELGELRQGVTKNFMLRAEWGGGTLALRNLDDPSKYLSAEFAAIGVDELTKNDREVFDFLRLRLRWPGVERPRFAGATNPGGRGHGWVKALWIDRQFPPELAPLADEFVFIPARAQDNPHLPASYYENLKTLPPAMARAYAEGDWNIFAGQYFDIFDPGKHVARAETLGLEEWWPRWISVDWGFEHPSAVHWHCQASEKQVPRLHSRARDDSQKGATVTYRELVQNRLSPRVLAAEIVERSAGEKIEAVFLGRDAFARRTDEATIAEQIGDVLVKAGLPRPAPADEDRIGGWMLMYELLQTDEWVIADSCRELIRVLPTLVRDERQVEDIEKVDGDDAADSARYGLKSRLGLGRKPIELLIRERVTSADPTVAMIQQRVAEKELLQSALVPRPGRFGWMRRRWEGKR